MVMAKGVEDCAFYRYSRLTSLNEVGGDPSGLRDRRRRVPRRRWPPGSATGRDAMTTLSTHDTKRGEDVRARIAVLAEVPDVWAGGARPAARRSRRCPTPASATCCGRPSSAPGRRRRERLHAYAEKAMREAGDRTTWTDPDEALRGAPCTPPSTRPSTTPSVRRSLDELLDARRRRRAGATRWPPSCVALTMPGVPDVYQGSELWEQRLVDPDNRRPVDFDAPRARCSPRSTRGCAARRSTTTGAAKLLVTRAALTLRRDRPELFTAYAAGRRRRARPPTTCSPSTAAARSPSPPGCRSGSPRAAAGATPSLDAARRRVARRAHRPASYAGDARRSTSCSRDLPGRAAGPGARPRDRGRGPLRRVGAARAARLRLSRRAMRVVEMAARRRRLVDARRRSRTPTGGGRLRLPARRRGHAAARPAVAAAAGGRARALAHLRPGRATRGPTTPGPAGSWPASVIYELHVGTFTPEGTLDAALGRLDHLRRLGVDLVELLPVNAFNGTHNWGYDGVLWYAVHEAYGGPAAYQRFVDACHAAGLGVIQDVVYNHLGPSGNYLPQFGPYLKSGAQHLGRPGQPRRRGLAPRCAATSSTTSLMWLRGLPRRRAAARRRARARRHLADRTCSRRWRSRSPRCRPTCAGR